MLPSLRNALDMTKAVRENADLGPISGKAYDEV
jgi:hypothetical protein